MDFKKLNSQYINGTWREGSSTTIMENKNPYNGEIIATYKAATTDDLNQAYQASASVQKQWANTNPTTQREVFEKAVHFIESNHESIVSIIIEEIGGTRLKAEFEIGLVTNIIKEASTFPFRMDGKILTSPIDHKENRVYRVPVGVVGVISPFNFPFFLSMKSVATALASGNGVVLKPHEHTAITGGTMIAKIFEDAGLPKGLLNVITTEIAEIGDYFVEHPIPRAISFTGSTKVGKHIGAVAGKNLKEAHLELGGNSALVVLDDADMDLAVSAAVFSRFTHQGQICMSANRLIVHEDVYDEFVEKYQAKVSTLTCGDPSDPTTIIGPLINEQQVKNTVNLIEKGIEEGATPIVHGGVKGNVVEPVVFTDVTPDMTLANEELFAPVISIMKVSSDEEVIAYANKSDYGLSGAIHTRDVERGAELAKQMDTGMIHINDGTINDEPNVAFGGVKNSGLGRLNGEWSLDAFTTFKWISIQHKARQYPYS
ncbi:aldehyde dehydrogenase family protein [Virgibacillus sp. AGTR]|uniref:Aldehyde dehydrogenase family protein n=1 Tax=Virgibacillus salarius TaxID=447199 RepID=A0A941E183_9BACI|nr:MULTISPECIES: aldehyde dehydrogenase family protein [Virgibacillus]NAZ09757.1 aldehyde dehydrogenase family protein [Agaribacter marinus]MBR7797048.1 aldehyde dehydrogenase family protein [Virgibacillus salarius]MCC2250751.1 aldehyde dehydrogenase family protein [Virgibacillus sp. AGTR]MDY7042831.1 aldehyde dehydrogenase family protein [Virgibacillus sp. M23]QRZ18073.1 aldehyde dehydrogenase family protein [Virgibacillus sp. AGTR]